MPDNLSKEERSAFMARIRSKNTQPEILIRHTLHSMGYRFRLHYRRLPGRPDLVFTLRRKVIFVHGCFWHAHDGCSIAHLPKTRVAYWQEKFKGNRARDERNLANLCAAGWDATVIWECELHDVGDLAGRLVRFLGPPCWEPEQPGVPQANDSE